MKKYFLVKRGAEWSWMDVNFSPLRNSFDNNFKSEILVVKSISMNDSICLMFRNFELLLL